MFQGGDDVFLCSKQNVAAEVHRYYNEYPHRPPVRMSLDPLYNKEVLSIYLSSYLHNFIVVINEQHNSKCHKFRMATDAATHLCRDCFRRRCPWMDG